MKSTILIVINSNSENLNCNSIMHKTKSEIIKYFGTKNIINEKISQPSIDLSCEITNEDLNYLDESINDSVNLFAIIIPDNCNKINGKVLDLSE